jgi:hypothetical protein
MSYTKAILRAVREIVAASKKPSQRAGTVVGRDDDTAKVLVIFDGDALAVPVKCFANVDAFPGDRVGLVRFDSDWIIVGSFTRHGPSIMGIRDILGVTSTSSASFVDMDGGHAFLWRKQYDETRTRITMMVSGYTNDPGSEVSYGVNIVGYADVTVAHNLYSAATHEVTSGIKIEPAFSAGYWWIYSRWRLNAGTGPVACNAADRLTVVVEEIPASQSTEDAGHTESLQ